MTADEFIARLIAENPEIEAVAPEVDPPFFLAENVYRLRTERGMTQAALAEAAGIAQPRIAEIERGDANPRLSTLGRLARVLGVSVADLVQEPSDDPADASSASPADDAAAGASSEAPERRRKAG